MESSLASHNYAFEIEENLNGNSQYMEGVCVMTAGLMLKC